ncbi:MAG: hypothetical protein LBC63_10790 [Holophagales bacterium]|jgi:hypothetical protein|nr:hypothetical protein [Holophagales bacterium]
MTDTKKMFFAAAFAAAALPLASQELWDPHLKLTAGMATNAEDNYVAQNRAYGLALAGAYPITVKGAVVFEGGYKFMPPTSQTYGTTVIDDKTDIYYAGAMCRYSLWRDGMYVQAGARGTNARTVRTTTNKGVGLWEKSKAAREVKTGWCFGLGYRLTNLWSFEVTASSAGFINLTGNQINSTIVEAALLIHR